MFLDVLDNYLYRYWLGFSMHVINRVIHERIIEKKLRLESKRPLSPSFVNRLRRELMIEYTYDSNAIEGNTLTLNETRLVIEEGITIGKRPISEIQEAKNHPAAIEFIEELIYGSEDLSEETVLQLNGLILKDVEPDAGKYRTRGVHVAGAVFSPPRSDEVPQLVKELLGWVGANLEEYSIIELGARFHHRFVQIHPFHDGNGRTARLLMNAILMRAGYPFLINISYRDRVKYLAALKEADLGDLRDFVNLVALSTERVLDVYLNTLEEPLVLTLKQASELCHYSAEYLGLLARKGRIAGFKKGNKWHITQNELMKYVDEMEARKR